MTFFLKTKSGLLFLVFFSFIANLQAIEKTTNQSGAWNNPSIWTPEGVPTVNDDVIINHVVSIVMTFNTQVNSIRIENISNLNAGIIFNNNSTIEVLGDFDIISRNFNSLAYLDFEKTSTLQINQNFNITRTIDNAGLGSFQVLMKQAATMMVNGDLNLNYQGANTLEDILEFDLKANASWTVAGIVTKNILSGATLNWEQKGNFQFITEGDYLMNMTFAQGVFFNFLEGSLFQIDKNASFRNGSVSTSLVTIANEGHLDFKQNLEMISSVSGAGVGFYLTGDSSVMKVAGTLDLKAETEGNLVIDLADSSKFYFGGNLTRFNGLGKLNMSGNAMWIYTGGNSQEFINPVGFGSDSFEAINVGIEIPEGEKMELSQDLIVTGELTLIKGILSTDSLAMLIIEDGASIKGGSPEAYIEGPVMKINLTPGEPFTYPLGHQGVYAPMTISSTGGRSAGKGVYTSKYLNCPPPWPGGMAANIQQLSSEEFWTLDRSEGSEDVNVRLHWTDATAQGITNTDDLVVAMFNPDSLEFPMFPSGWTSIGQQDLIGGAGDGISGSIMNIGTCPPPWGISLFSFASTSNSNALPVEMESFSAKLRGENVEVQWRTTKEVNVDYFVVEKSLDGTFFFEIERMGDEDQFDSNGAYQIIDFHPQIGNNYYRILQMDFDGMSAYSEIKIVGYVPIPDLKTFPNPSSEYISLSGNIISEAKYIDVLDANGRVFFTREIQSPLELSKLDLQDLNINIPGVYFVKVSNGRRSESVKLIKN